MMKSLTHLLLASTFWALGALPDAAAHPLDPALLEIRESGSGVLDVLWRMPTLPGLDAALQPVLPDSCKAESMPDLTRSDSRITARWRVSCRKERGLVGRTVGITGLRERQTDALLRVHLADGRLIQRVLQGTDPTFRIPERTSRLNVFSDYLGLGFGHILSGPDHLLFVLGLVLLLAGWRRLLWTITAFTAGHSVTLSLAVLGVVKVPPQPVEALIALTIVMVALELTRSRPGTMSWVHRFPWALAFSFGLLHGLGFAGALTQVGLPAEEIPLALGAFNLGIEAGQILWVLSILALRWALKPVPWPWPKLAGLAPAYLIGSLGAFWLLERSASLF